ncbi:hypothetical protein ENUP19_0020G0054 [Entamoeba nuttalli]|uniref:Translation initiation factor beta propellor-like domain-containing protein n=1 Tax=Entamoeba nuttalli TaxID=412467 RepID=A0ABQ0D8Y7_9EUKA
MSASTKTSKITQSSVLICDGLPVGIPVASVPKLTLFLKRMVLVKNGAELSDQPNNVQVFVDETSQKTTGIGFIDFKDDEAAIKFKTRFVELKFDNKNTLKFYTKKEIDEILKENDEYTPLVFHPIEVTDFKGWLKEDKYTEGSECVATFQYGKTVSLGWYNPSIPKEITMQEEQPFISSNCSFSPSGTFLYSITEHGLIVVQPDCKKKFQFPHPGLTHVTISPHDTFIATYSATAPFNRHIIVWDRRFTKGIKFFDLKANSLKRMTETLKKEKTLTPIGQDFVQFSYNEKYLARISEVDSNSIEIYTTPTIQLLSNKLVTFESSIDKISWSPKANIIVAYHEPLQKTNEQAHFYFYDVDKQEIIFKHKVFSLKGAEFGWHSSGKKLVVQCNKNKKTAVLVFTLDKTITASMNELNATPHFMSVNPIKMQFGIMAYQHSKKGDSLFPTLHIYDISSNETKLISSLPNIEAKSFSYSPNGQFMVVSGISTSEPYLYFYNTDRMKLYKKVPIENMSYICWDPMGLFLGAVRSYLYSPHAKNGFMLYDCFGNLQFETYKTNFAGLLWRPQPTNIIKPEMTKEVESKFNECLKTMKEEDERKKEQIELEKKQRADELMKRFRSVVQKNAQLSAKEHLRAYDSGMKIIVEEIKQKKESNDEVKENITENQ